MENEKEWESRETPTKLQFCSDLWGKHWLFWQLRGLPAVSFAVSDLQIRKGICGSDLTQSFQPWRLPLPHHQYHLWYLLQVTNLVRAWSQQEIDKHKKNMGKAVPTWNYLIHRRIWLTLMQHERENSTAYGLLPDDGSLKESKPVHQKQTLALSQQPTANTTCWMFPRPRKQDALRRFCSMKTFAFFEYFAQEGKSANHFGLSTSLGRRFGWNANTVRSRVFCSMRGHACLRISGDHSSMDSEKMGAQNDSLNLFRLTFATSSH